MYREMKINFGQWLLFGLVAQHCTLPAADIQNTFTGSLTVHQPGVYEISWPRQTAWDGSVYQVEVATAPAGPWQPLIGRVVQWGPWIEDLKRTHRTTANSRFFRLAMVGHSSVMPISLTPTQAMGVHQGFLQDRNLAFDEAFIVFREPTDLDRIVAANGLLWERVQKLSPTEAWYRAVDGVSSGDRGLDLANQLTALNARNDVKVAYSVLMYLNLRQFTTPRVVVQFKPGQPYGDLAQALGDSISFGGASSTFPDTVYYNLTRPKETNLYELLQLFRSHLSVESADFDGYLQIGR